VSEDEKRVDVTGSTNLKGRVQFLIKSVLHKLVEQAKYPTVPRLFRCSKTLSILSKVCSCSSASRVRAWASHSVPSREVSGVRFQLGLRQCTCTNPTLPYIVTTTSLAAHSIDFMSVTTSREKFSPAGKCMAGRTDT
jgi:hypothetical protein